MTRSPERIGFISKKKKKRTNRFHLKDLKKEGIGFFPIHTRTYTLPEPARVDGGATWA
jgi:hypothetical protein